jgi:Glycosyl hydrolases family 38 N-terminal domain/Alpha mannosidase middle domain/Glycosyl hydrolases family 38 C-terminal domain
MAMTAPLAPASPTAVRTVHVVPHTHWDREWYLPFQTFRLRLVGLIDGLLDAMEADPRLAFTLDGQLATVDDYLEVRPENEARVRGLIRAGRLAVGPWLILMDEFLVSGETIVRNLEVGTRRAEELGGAMAVGYLPDMFGHIAQMPQILRRAGIGHAVVWRGVPAAIDRHAFRWFGPDGSMVRTEYLLGGYGNARDLFVIPDPAIVRDRIARFVRSREPIFGDRPILAMYGEDHSLPEDDYGDLVDAVNASGDPVHVVVGTLADYVRATAEDPADTASLADWHGELRSGARANVLMGVTSHRADVKQAAGRAERLLERLAEPLAALHGATWPARLLELAWRRVIENSAHDSICACSMDAVDSQVLARFAEAEQIAAGIVAAVGRDVGSHVPRGAHAVLNPTPAERDALVELDARVPLAGAAPGDVGRTAAEGDEPPADRLAIALPDGSLRPTQEIGRRPRVIAEIDLSGREVGAFFEVRAHMRELFTYQMNGFRVERPGTEDAVGGAPAPTILTVDVDEQAEPPDLDVDGARDRVVAEAAGDGDSPWRIRVVASDRRRLVARVPAPALGWSAVRVVAAVPRPDPDPVTVAERSIANGRLTVEVADDGTLTLTGGGRRLAGVGRLVDGGDVGDAYNYAPPATDTLVETPRDVRVDVAETGPLRGALVVHRTYDIPSDLLGDPDTAPDETARNDETVAIEVVMRVELHAGEPFARVALDWENRAIDHRLRFHVPLALAATTSHAEGQFAVVDRPLTMEGGHGERPLATFPAHGWVAAGGAAILTDHVMEYELVDGTGRDAGSAGARELALTVLRSTGTISRTLHPWRAEPAGPVVATPAAQRLGPVRVAFALLPCSADWATAGIDECAEAYRLPFVVADGRGAPEVGLDVGEGLDVAGDGVLLSALRQRDDRIEARILNLRPDRTVATIRGAFATAREADLLGRPGPDLVLREGGRLDLELGPWAFRTIQLD